MAARVEAITRRPAKRQAWKDLGAHYKKIREVHLRQLFADDPQRGTRLTAEALGLFLDYSKNRITDQPSSCCSSWPRNLACGNESTPCFVVRRSTSRRSGRFCTRPCAHPGDRPSSWTARTWYPRCMQCSTGWRISLIESGVASGRASPASVFAT